MCGRSRGEMTPEAQAIVDNAVLLDETLSSSLSVIDDQQHTIANLQQQVALLTAKPVVPKIFQPTTRLDLERGSGWFGATDHDVNVKPHGTYTLLPAADEWTDFSIKPACEWDNFYMYLQCGAQP